MQNVTTKTETILSVVPGTRSSGLAVFEGLDLIYYRIKEASKHRSTHTAHSRAREVARMVEQLIHKYRPHHFVTLKPHAFQCLSPKLPVIAEHITNIARRFGLIFHEYSKAEIRRQLCPGGRATRQAVASHLSVLYPELSRYAREVSLWQWLYYARMFDAVAAGFVLSREFMKRKELVEIEATDQLRAGASVRNSP